MPFSLVKAFGGQQMNSLVNLLKFLSPITTQSCTGMLAM
jgi:hypothetical protein